MSLQVPFGRRNTAAGSPPPAPSLRPWRFPLLSRRGRGRVVAVGDSVVRGVRRNMTVPRGLSGTPASPDSDFLPPFSAPIGFRCYWLLPLSLQPAPKILPYLLPDLGECVILVFAFDRQPGIRHNAGLGCSRHRLVAPPVHALCFPDDTNGGQPRQGAVDTLLQTRAQQLRGFPSTFGQFRTYPTPSHPHPFPSSPSPAAATTLLRLPSRGSATRIPSIPLADLSQRRPGHDSCLAAC